MLNYDDVVRGQDQSTGGNGGLEEYKERLQSEQDAMKKTQEEANAQIEALKADKRTAGKFCFADGNTI